MPDIKYTANNFLDDLMLSAVKGGAKPSEAVKRLGKLEADMCNSYREGKLKVSLRLAEEIGDVANIESDRMNVKWEERIKSGAYKRNPFEDPEYLEDFVNMRICAKYLEAYGTNGENIALIRQFNNEKEQGKRRYNPPDILIKYR